MNERCHLQASNLLLQTRDGTDCRDDGLPQSDQYSARLDQTKTLALRSAIADHGPQQLIHQNIRMPKRRKVGCMSVVLRVCLTKFAARKCSFNDSYNVLVVSKLDLGFEVQR